MRKKCKQRFRRIIPESKVYDGKELIACKEVILLENTEGLSVDEIGAQNNIPKVGSVHSKTGLVAVDRWIAPYPRIAYVFLWYSEKAGKKD